MIFRNGALKLMPIYSLYVLINGLTWNFMYLYFFKSGLNVFDMMVFNFVIFIFSTLYFFIPKKFYIKRNYMAGFFLRLCSLLILAFFQNKWFFYLAAVFLGLAIVLHWTSFNIMYYHFINKDHVALMSAVLFIFRPIVAMFAPLMSVFIIQEFGYPELFLATSVFCVFALFLQHRAVKEHVIKLNVSSAIKKLKGLKTIIFLTGMLLGVPWFIFPVYLLFYVDSELKFGLFFAYIGFVSVLSTILVSHFSDHSKKRKKFFYPLIWLYGLSFLSLTFVQGLYSWTVLIGINAFISMLVVPFISSLLPDTDHNKYSCWIGREVLLNISRALLVIITMGLIYLRIPMLVFLLMAILCFFLPFIFNYKKIYDKFERKDSLIQE